jgi:outer membrane protein TolC
MRSTSPQWTAFALLAAGLAGCAATDDAPRQATGPAAIDQAPPIADSAVAGSPSAQQAAFEQPESAGNSPRPRELPPAGGLTPTEVVPAPAAESVERRQSFPLDLATALGMTQDQNPRVAFAQAQIAQSQAVHEAARALWLPSLRAGMNYNKHEGVIQDVRGVAFPTSRGAAFGGLGAGAVGAASPAVPGVYMQFHTTDAIYQRRITGYALSAREFQGTAVTNDQLLETALAYLALLEAHQRRAIALETLKHGEELVKVTGEFARTGAGNQADADRAAAALALVRNDAVRTEEAVAVAAARLAQHLSLDPALIIEPQEPAVVPIELAPVELPLGDLVATGLSNRPELAASRSLVCEAVNRLRREEHAPWLPSILLGASYGGFAAGLGGDITNGGDRFDFDGVAWWEVRNLGFGERAARDNARAQIQQARLREVETLDLVAREVVEAQTQTVARKKQIAVAEEGIASAQRSYDRNLNRIRNAQGLPIEVLQSIQALDAARREYLRALIDYNSAQFRLQRALGWPIGAHALPTAWLGAQGLEPAAAAAVPVGRRAC